MEINSKIYTAIKENNNIISTTQIQNLGFSKTLISNYVKSGLLERIKQGVYTLSDELYDDMYTLMLSSEKIIFSHETAAFLNEIYGRTPCIHSVTIPSGKTLPRTIRDDCKCYYVKEEFHTLGLTRLITTFGNEVRTYNAERTICDILRSKNRIDEETFIDIMKNYASSDKKDLNLLFSYAKKLGTYNKLRMYMEVLL